MRISGHHSECETYLKDSVSSVLTRLKGPSMTHRSRSPRVAGVTATLSVAALALTACGGGTDATSDIESFADMETVNLKVATIYGPDNYSTQAIEAYTESVTEATDGKVTFEFFYAGSLLPQNEMAQGLSDGTIDFAEFMPVYTPADYPVDNWASKLGFMSESSPIVGSTQAKSATWDFAYHEPAFAEEMTSNNIHGLIPRSQTVHTYDLACKTPVTSLEDIQGKRIRVGGEAWAGEVENLGGTPVNLPSSESYTALQQGVTDCHLGGAQEIDGMGLTDVAKHYTALGLTGWTSAALGLNQDTWDELPSIAQDAFVEQLPTLALAQAEQANGATFEFFTNAADAGVEFHEIDDAMQEKIDTYHEGLLTSLVEDAPAEVEDPQAAVDYYLASHEKWKTILTDELGYSDDAASWAEYVEQNDEVVEDFEAWAEKVGTEVFETNAAQGTSE